LDVIGINIKLYSIFSQFSGKRDIQLILPKNTQVLDALESLRPEIGDVIDNYILTPDRMLRGSCVIMLNQRNIECFQYLKTQLEDGDLIEIIPPLSGG